MSGSYCVGTVRWRVLRRLALSGGSADWEAVRGHSRNDPLVLTGPIRAGLVRAEEAGFAGPDPPALTAVELTARGRLVQDLGLVSLAEFDLLGPATRPAAEAPSCG